MRNNRINRRRRGVAAAEFAVCLPVIVVLVVGAIETSTMIFLKQSLTVAAYEGGRTSTIPGATTDDVRTTCQEILADRRVNGAAINVTPDVEFAAIGEFVEVEVTAPCNQNTMIAGRFFRNRNLSGASRFMKEF